jgi:integrase
MRQISVFVPQEPRHLDSIATTVTVFLNQRLKRLQEITGRNDLTPHMLRHLCITKLYEAGNSRSMVKDIASHVSNKMSDYYDHPRMEAQATAVNSINLPNVIPFESAKKRKLA